MNVQLVKETILGSSPNSYWPCQNQDNLPNAALCDLINQIISSDSQVAVIIKI